MGCVAIIVAAGRGDRLGASKPKAFVDLAGKPLVVHALERFEAAGVADEIVVVVHADHLEAARALLADHLSDRRRIVVGGERRQDSVRNGLAAISQDHDLVAVHDAARPLVSVGLIRATVEEAGRRGAAIAAVALTDTPKEVDAAGRIVASPSRERLWLAQTPQVFRTALLREAHDRALRDGSDATDDAALVATLGAAVFVVPGEPGNLKITRPEDLIFAEALLRK